MYSFPLPNRIKYFTLVFIFAGISFLYAQDSTGLSPREEQKLTGLQRQARIYRNQGFTLQSTGNLERAMILYQKSVELDPLYAVAYNDLGIIYEIKGLSDRAEESYLKSIKCDPYFLSAYSNLALLYENKREFDKASIYWRKRAELGTPDDPWTKKAKRRIADIRMVGLDLPYMSREQKVVGLTKDVLRKKTAMKEDNRKLAADHLHKAKINYLKGDEIGALREAIDAKSLDPTNSDIDDFIDKVQRRLLIK